MALNFLNFQIEDSYEWRNFVINRSDQPKVEIILERAARVLLKKCRRFEYFYLCQDKYGDINVSITEPYLFSFITSRGRSSILTKTNPVYGNKEDVKNKLSKRGDLKVHLDLFNYLWENNFINKWQFTELDSLVINKTNNTELINERWSDSLFRIKVFEKNT